MQQEKMAQLVWMWRLRKATWKLCACCWKLELTKKQQEKMVQRLCVCGLERPLGSCAPVARSCADKEPASENGSRVLHAVDSKGLLEVERLCLLSWT